MAAKKKRKFTKDNWDKLKSQAQERTETTIQERKRMPHPETIDYCPAKAFNHPTPNYADWDMIYLRGKK